MGENDKLIKLSAGSNMGPMLLPRAAGVGANGSTVLRGQFADHLQLCKCI